MATISIRHAGEYVHVASTVGARTNIGNSCNSPAQHAGWADTRYEYEVECAWLATHCGHTIPGHA